MVFEGVFVVEHVLYSGELKLAGDVDRKLVVPVSNSSISTSKQQPPHYLGFSV